MARALERARAHDHVAARRGEAVQADHRRPLPRLLAGDDDAVPVHLEVRHGRSSTLCGAMTVDVTEATFEREVLDRSHQLPVVVDFWAEWCGPCRALGPVLEKAVDEREGKVVLAKLDTEANPRIAAAFRIQSIPAVKAFRDGRVVSEFVGAQPPPAVARFLDELLPSEADALVEARRRGGAAPGARARAPPRRRGHGARAHPRRPRRARRGALDPAPTSPARSPPTGSPPACAWRTASRSCARRSRRSTPATPSAA